MHARAGVGRRRVEGWRGGWPALVREGMPAYEDEGSARQSRGAVPVGGDSWWSVTLSAPVGAGAEEAGPVVIRVERLGPPAPGAPRALGAELLVPRDEVDAIPALLAGVVSQARRDGVLRGGVPVRRDVVDGGG